MGVLAIVGLAPLGTGVWRIIDLNGEALITSMQEYQLLLASSTAEKVDLKIDGLSSELVRAAQAVGGRTGAGRDGIRHALTDVLDDRVGYLRFVPRSSEQPISVGRLPASLSVPFQVLVARAEAASDGREGVVVSQPIVSEEPASRSSVVISVPVLADGHHRGELSALVDLQSIWDSVTTANQGGAVVYALDDSGRVFASTAPSLIRPGEDRSRSALPRRFLSGEGRARETMPFKESQGEAETEFLGSYATTRQGWGVFVRAETRGVYLPLREVVSSTLAWGLAVLGLAAVGAVIFALSISGPISKLALASRAFARGEFSTRVHVRTRNEIGELAHTFNAMASEIGQHIEKLKVAASDNEDLFEGTIRALAEAIDAKDPYTRGHSVRVNRYCLIVANRLGLSAEETRNIHVAALLHDAGKIGVDDAILKKPGRLTPDEYEAIKKHAALGASIMAPIPQMAGALPGLRWHHERMDGSGYPDGLKGEQIPLVARIIAVADVFDAVTSDRSYQETRALPEGMELLTDLKGLLDPRIVDVFAEAYDSGEIQRIGREQRSRSPVLA